MRQFLWSKDYCAAQKRIDVKVNIPEVFLSTTSKTSARVSSGFQTREAFETTRTQAEWFYCFWAFGNLMKPEARVFEITSPTKKISLNYDLNKFSQSKDKIR